ncbi:MAG: PLP-dependent aminotransferase family protein [Microbacterium sp.]
MDQPNQVLLEGLERSIRRFGPPAICYTIPTFHNPTGTSLSEEKRGALVELSRRHGFRIIEDDPYSQLRFSGSPEPSLLSLDPERVIHLTSLSKTIAPGLRCGAVVLPEDLIDSTVRIVTGMYIAPGQLAQATAALIVGSPAYEQGLTRAVDELRRRRDVVLSGLGEIGWECDPPAGGYFAWPYTGDVDTTRLSRAAQRVGVIVVPGNSFYLDHGGRHRLRLTWAALNTTELAEALNRLSAAVTSVRRRSQAPEKE